jgi:hypothetical protein
MDSLIAAALDARTVADVDGLEEELQKRLGGGRVRYLGDKPANWSALAGPVDPRAVIFERVTNAWDAIIEAEAQRSQDFTCHTPAEAAHRFLGVPREGPSEMGAGGREGLAARTLLTLHDSDESKKRPTIATRDTGVGISRAEMPGTILSLESDNKLGKEYLHGVFGKGGSVACLFSRATIIVTRKQPDLLADDEEDLVSLAVVRQGDAPDMKLPFFRYLADPADELPYAVPAAETDFEPGTLVMHVGYQAERMGQQQWQFEESIYAYAETLLFRPTLPYQLHDARSAEANARPEGRQKPSTLMGLGQRLDALKPADGLLDRGGPARMPVPGVGEVGMRWWLLDDEDRRRRRIAKGNMTLFITGGQVHRAWDTARFISLVDGRRRVGRRLIVEIDTEPIPQKKRVTIFSSFRETMLKSPEAAAVERAVAEWLASEPNLDDAESKFTRQALHSTGEEVSPALRQRLNRAIRARIPGLGGTGSGAAPRQKPPKPKPREELYDEPTTLTGPEELQVLPGQRRMFYAQANAVDGFVPDRGDIELVVAPGSPSFEFGKGDLRRGRLQLSLFAPADSDLGEYSLEMALSWLRSAGGVTTLTWPVKVKVVSEIRAPKPPPGGHGRKKTPQGETAFIWSNPDNQPEWDDDVVGDLQNVKGDDLAAAQADTYKDLKGVEDTIPTVVLNERFRDLQAYKRSVASKIGDQALRTRLDKYALAVGVAVANLSAQEEKLAKAYTAWEQSENGAEPEKAMTEAQMRRGLAHHARGVLALMPDFDELLGDVNVEEAAAT